MNIVCPSLYVLLQVGLQIYNRIILWKAAIQQKNYQFKSNFKWILKYVDNIHLKTIGHFTLLILHE
jgi:hypothetical protein